MLSKINSLLIVSPRPCPTLPTAPPAVLTTPPVRFPRVEVRPLAAPSAPEVVEEVVLVLDCPIGMVFLLFGWLVVLLFLFWWEKKGVLEVLVSTR